MAGLMDFTPEVEAALRADAIEYARIVDVFLDNGLRHYWEYFHPLTIDDGVAGPVEYLPVGDRIIPPDTITEDQSLDDNTITIELDSSRATDGTDFVGELLDNTLIQRRVRIRSVLFRAGSNLTEPIWIFNEQNGVIDQTPDRIRAGDQSVLSLRIASGTFAYLERRQLTYTDADQQALFPGDTSLQRLAQLVDINLPWGGEFR